MDNDERCTCYICSIPVHDRRLATEEKENERRKEEDEA